MLCIVSKSLAAAGKPSTEAQAAAKSAVDDFFDKKKSRLHRCVVTHGEGCPTDAVVFCIVCALEFALSVLMICCSRHLACN